jgi:hypothetical protein
MRSTRAGSASCVRSEARSASSGHKATYLGGFAESVAPLIVAFAGVTVAWLLEAAGSAARRE